MARPPICCATLQGATRFIAGLSITFIMMGLLGLTALIGLNAYAHAYGKNDPRSENSLYSSPVLTSTENGTDYDETNIMDMNSTTIRPLIPDIISHNGQIYVSLQKSMKISMQFLAVCITSLIVILVTKLIVAVQLWKGAKERNHTRCKVWFHVEVAQWIIGIFIFIGLQLYGFNEIHSNQINGNTVHSFRWIGFLFGNLFKAYFIWIVHAFMRELKDDMKCVTYEKKGVIQKA